MTTLIDRVRTLATAGRASVEVAHDPPVLLAAVSAGPGDLVDRLENALAGLRKASSREGLRERGVDREFGRGYRIEDVVAAAVVVPPSSPGRDLAWVRAWFARRLPRSTALEVLAGSGVTLSAAFARRVGHAPGRPRYRRQPDGRLRVEAFELHVTEHCNLRCANCCNMSPLVARHTASVAEVRAMCRRMARVLVADVFKIMGGEPLLHPDIVGVLDAVREVGIGDRVRLFTNGLLLRTVPEEFWSALDELTISDYTSAPVKPAILDLARARSREHGFVLNVKPVGEFSQVLSPRFRRGDAQVRSTYRRCWLRHRCLIVRRGRFFMCTRAAYADDFLERAAHEPVPHGHALDRSGDGVDVGDVAGPLDIHGTIDHAASIDDAELARRLEAYMNRTEPLGACRYCFGGDGGTEAHAQLSKDEVARGVLSQELTDEEWMRR